MALQQWFDPARPGGLAVLMIEVVAVAQRRHMGETKTMGGSND
jgi:hypothetical protein